MREKAKTCFLKINYKFAEIEIFVRIEADQHERTKWNLHKIAGKLRWLVPQQTNKRQLLQMKRKHFLSSFSENPFLNA